MGCRGACESARKFGSRPGEVSAQGKGGFDGRGGDRGLAGEVGDRLGDLENLSAPARAQRAGLVGALERRLRVGAQIGREAAGDGIGGCPGHAGDRVPVCAAFARSKNAITQLGRRRPGRSGRDVASGRKVDEDREVIQELDGGPALMSREGCGVADAAIAVRVAAGTRRRCGDELKARLEAIATGTSDGRHAVVGKRRAERVKT